jgi:uncharacterized protein YnzC (UPF0291/DUF896 family)
VEGQGESGAVPVLLRRIWELLGGEYIEILTPFRCSKQKLLQESEMIRILDLSGDDVIPEKPEETRQGKGWIQKRFRGDKYTPSFDQPRLTWAMDLALCRSRSPSFDKLCRELEARLRRTL